MSEVSESFTRIKNQEFAERFYAIFLEADPRIKPLFKNTDFKKQKDLLLHGIWALLEFADGNYMGKLAVDRLGELHSQKQMNIDKDMYPLWVDCILKIVREKDPEYSGKLEIEWRSVLEKGIKQMLEHY